MSSPSYLHFCAAVYLSLCPYCSVCWREIGRRLEALVVVVVRASGRGWGEGTQRVHTRVCVRASLMRTVVVVVIVSDAKQHLWVTTQATTSLSFSLFLHPVTNYLIPRGFVSSFPYNCSGCFAKWERADKWSQTERSLFVQFAKTVAGWHQRSSFLLLCLNERCKDRSGFSKPFSSFTALAALRDVLSHGHLFVEVCVQAWVLKTSL